MSIVSLAHKRAAYRVENPGSLAACSLVEVAWILFENRRHDGAADKCSRENVGVSRSEALCVALRPLAIGMPAISGLVNSSQEADSGESDRIAGRLPGQLELVFRRERSRIGDVADIEVGNHPKDTL